MQKALFVTMRNTGLLQPFLHRWKLQARGSRLSGLLAGRVRASGIQPLLISNFSGTLLCASFSAFFAYMEDSDCRMNEWMGEWIREF